MRACLRCAAVLHTGARLLGPSTSGRVGNRCKVHTWIRFQRWQDLVDQKAEWDAARERERFYTPGGIYWTAENPETDVPQKPMEDRPREERGGFRADWHFAHGMFRYLDWSGPTIKRYSQYQRMLTRQYDQRYIVERQLFLGADLAAAYFLVHRQAAVKVLGDDMWLKQDEKGNYELPPKKVPNFYLEAIDASGTELMFEGFDNMTNLRHLRLLRLANCPYVNDWCLTKMEQFAPSLEFLDLSGCSQITAKGLTGLAVLKNLKYLRIANVGDGIDTAKVALMLEESIPGLQVMGVDFDAAQNRLEREKELASLDNVVEDARGNLFLFDELGKLFPVGGAEDRNYRGAVDSLDRPLITSVIRPDPPMLPLSELIRVDQMTKGRLRHYLLGSPSSLHWSTDVEHIVGFLAHRALKAGAKPHPLMLPGTVPSLQGGDDQGPPSIGPGDQSEPGEGRRLLESARKKLIDSALLGRLQGVKTDR